MRYLRKATIESGGIWYSIISTILAAVSIYINAEILTWITLAMQGTNVDKNVNLVIVGCALQVIISYLCKVTDVAGHSRVFTKLTDDFIDKITNADYDMFTKFSAGTLLTTTESIWSMTSFFRTILDIINNSIRIIVTLIMIWKINKIVTFPILIGYIIAGIIFSIILRKRKVISKKFNDIRYKRNVMVDEMINGFAESRSFGKEKFQQEESYQTNQEILDILRRRSRYAGVSNSWLDIMDGFITIALMLYMIMQVQGNLIMSTMAVTIIMYSWRLFDPILSIADTLVEINDTMVSIPKFEAVMNYENTVSKGTTHLDIFESEIELRNVKFGYDSSSYVLDGVNMKTPKGSHIGICGSSGGGKSTLLKLLPKFYDPSEGEILFDGIDSRILTQESIRSHMGIVNQSPHIFDTTIRENIGYAKKYGVVSDEEIEDAAKKACIYDFIMSLPDKFETQVGPKGLKLSGGQKQRIALARVFLANPEIIILDEATSALDNETETLVQDALNAFKDKTMIVVAHRLSTIKDSDKIFVIDKHVVAEECTHEELVRKNGVYARMLK